MIFRVIILCVVFFSSFHSFPSQLCTARISATQTGESYLPPNESLEYLELYYFRGYRESSDPTEMALAAIEGLARLGQPYERVVEILRLVRENPRLRNKADEALKRLNSPSLFCRKAILLE